MSNKKRTTDVNPKTGLPVLNEESTLAICPKHGFLYYLVVVPVFLLVRIIFLPRIRGVHNIAKTGGQVLAFNHIATFDAALLLATAPRKLFFIAKAELFQMPQKIFFNQFGIIPVDRSRKNTNALSGAVKVLQGGGVVAIAPEGTTNQHQVLRPFKFGAVAMASKAKVPIVPVAITGRYIPFFGKLKIEYGKPVKVGKNLEKSNEALRDAITAMRATHRKKTVKQSDGWLQVMVKPILLLFVKLVYRPAVIGRRHIPPKSAIVIAANHKHDLDPFLIMSGRLSRRVHFVAKHECMDWKIGRAIGAFGVVFVDRNTKDKTVAKNTVLGFLHKGRVVALFPEGTRNKTQDLLLPFCFGAVSFAQKSGAWLVPAAIVGEYRPFKKGLKIIFERPMKIGKNDNLETANRELYQTIEKLLKENGEENHRPNIHNYYQKQRKGTK
jgi:1-acyl-sn-glycerol-3-phosphate acyltransferase